MTPKEALEKIKMLFNEAAPVEPSAPATEFVEAKTVDGKSIKADNWNVGTPVTIVTEEGELPMPDGEHELEGGKILITAGGLVVEVKDKPAEEPMQDTALASEVEGLKTELAAIKLANAEIKTLADNLTAKFEAMQTTNKKAIADLCDVVTQIAESPIAEPKKEEVPNEKFARAERKATAIDRLANTLTKIKN